MAYYTVDDGATWFKDVANRVPPFEAKGKEAVRAYLFTCDKRKTKFVGYLLRFTAEEKAKLDATAGQPLPDVKTLGEGVEVKVPQNGSGAWVSQTDPAAAAILDVKCPDGTTDHLEPVMP